MTDSITPEQQSALRSAHEDGQLYSALAEAISAKAVEKFEERHARSRAYFLTLIIAALGILSGGLTLVVDELFDARIERKVATAINEQFGSLDFASRVGALNFDVRRIEDSKYAITAEEGEKIVNQIEKLYEGYASKRAEASGLKPLKVTENRNLLTYAIETMVANSEASYDDALVLRLADIAPDITDKSAMIAQTLLQVHGRDLIGAPAGAAAWTEANGARVETFKNYRTYALRAEKQGYPELFIAFEMLTRQMENRPRAEIEQLADRIADLNEPDHGAFVDLMTSLATQGFKTEPDSETLLAAQRVRAFLAEYADASERLKAILVSLPPLPAN